MSRLHENSVKWLNEQIKKKCKTKTGNVEEDLKQCIYCPKIFKSSSFVIKHIFKRHGEQFLRHHKKFMGTTSSDLGLDPEAVLINYLKSEFCNIKSELEIVKIALVTHYAQDGDNTKNQVICSAGCQKCSDSNTNALENEPSLNNSKHLIKNMPEEDFRKLQEKVEEMSQKYKEIISSNKEMAYLLEDRICKRLKKELIKDFENLLIQNRDSEWKPHLSQLKKDMNKLEKLVELNSKKIESPEVQQEVRNKIDEQIQSFFENYGIVEEKSRTSLKTNHKGSSNSSLNMNAHRVNRRAKSIFTSISQDPNLALKAPIKTYDPQLQSNDPQTSISGSQSSVSSWRQLDTSIKTKDPQLQVANVSESSNVQPSSIHKEVPDSIRKIGTRRAKVIFVEKLKDFGLSRETKQLSVEEYERKNHLVNAEKELLCQKYKNFQELYASLDSHANELVKSHMERKFRKHLRFSDSINFQASESKDKIVPDHEPEKSSSPFEKVISPFMDQSEFMQDMSAGGDFNVEENCEKPNSNCARNLAKGNCESNDKVVIDHEKKSLSQVEKVISPFMNQSQFMQDLGACSDKEDCEKPNLRNLGEGNSKLIGKAFIEHKRKKTLSTFQTKTSPFTDQSECMQDLGACGDFSAEELAWNMKKDHFASGVASKKTGEFKFQECVVALPQNVASNTSFSEPSGKVSYPGPSNDRLQPIEEFSELSSLESDTDLFLNEFDQL